MFKASVFLVAAALITLAYGWVSGIDLVLYASIAFSAVAGLALLASTIADRKKYPKDTKDQQPPAEPPKETPRPPLRRDPEKGWIEDTSPGRAHSGWPEQAEPTRLPEPTFSWSEEQEAPATSAGSSEFRSRLAAALSAGDEEAARARRPERGRSGSRPAPARESPPPEAEEEVEQDWIPIEDLPGMSDDTPPPARPRRPRKPRVVEAASAKPSRPRGLRRSSAAEAREEPAEEEPTAAPQDQQEPSESELKPAATDARPRIRPRPRS